MSFSYKTLSSNDIALTSYIANKQWGVNTTTLSQNGVTIYIGENLPINKINLFDPTNDSQTSNEEYRRLVYDSIKNLYYQNYTSGSLTGQFFHSSSFFNYEQSTLTSGSMLAAHRNIPTMTGSSAIGVNPTLFSSALYNISSSLYDQTGFDPDQGSKIVVISIDQNVFGSGLSPKSVIISGSTYNIQDDGEGNLFDTLATSSLYVGNVFYSQGLIVITDQDYLCIFGAPPTTTNDYYSYQNVLYNSQSLEILSNDFADCGGLDPTSVQLMSVPGFSFPNYTLNNGIITITPDQTSIIPGTYQLNYTIGNYNGIRSNTSSINLTITSQSLQLTNITSSLVCFASTASTPVTFSINYGVPPYSYSLNNGVTYTGVPGFFDKTVSGSITASLTNIIYIKDYMGVIVSQSFSSWYQPVTYTISSQKLPCSGSNNGRLGISQIGFDTGVSASIDGGSYFALPKLFTGISSGSHTLRVKDLKGCITSSIIPFEVYTPLTASVTQSNVTCYGSSNGFFSVTFTNVVDNCIVNLIDPTGSNYYTNVSLSSFPNNTVTASNLATGSWNLSVDGTAFCSNCCQVYNNTFNITSPTTPTFIVTASYIDSCSNAIIISGSGGTSPYLYYAVETGSGLTFSSDSSPLSLDGLNAGNYSLFVVDSNGCNSLTSSINIFGRTYQYTGSFCVQTASVNTGYVSSSGIQQVFTSGPYSGSVVTSSYSNGTTLYGPTLNFTQNFTSGTQDSLIPCSIAYNRYRFDGLICAPNGCFPPILTDATPISCSNFNYTYNVTYNSSSTSASYTVVQYSLNSNFSAPVGSAIRNNTSPLTSSFNMTSSIGYIDADQVVYFRAYNSCSNGATSSWSNVLTASCLNTPEPGPFTLKIINYTGGVIKYRPFTASLNYSLANYQSASLTFSDDNYWVNIYHATVGVHQYTATSYIANLSSSAAVNGNVYSNMENVNTGDNVYIINTYYPTGSDFLYTPDNISASPDLYVNIDKTNYFNPGEIILTITGDFN